MNWNGKTVSADAHRIAKQIEAATGMVYFPTGFNIAAVKTELRRFYVATGGVRGPKAPRDPNNEEYRNLYNGVYTGAELFAIIGGGKAPERAPKAPKAEKAPERPVVTEEKTDAQKLAELLSGALGGQKIDPEAVKAIAVNSVNERVGEMLSSMAGLVAEEVAKAVRKVEIKVAEGIKVEFDLSHKVLERVVRYAANRRNILLVGPAGSGKTTIAEQVAKAIGMEGRFFATGKVADETKLLGFVDAGGTYRRTSFREAYEHGGVFLFDEMDGSSPDALVAFNAPLAGDWGDFPDGMVRRNPDFVAIAAANTFGRGADRMYVGREQLDAATLDRFAVIEVDYDEELELAMSANRDWTLYVQKVRAAVVSEKVRHIVSPRASKEGSIMLAAGESQHDVEEAYVWKGMEETVRNRVKAAMR